MFTLTPPDEVVQEGAPCALEDLDLEGSEVAVSLGGDGTFLRLASLAWSRDVPILGVNFGHLGYLLPLMPENLEAALHRGARR